MDKILRDLSPARLITAIEENLFAWIPFFGKLGEVRINDPVCVRRSITDIPISLFNSIMDAQLAIGQVEQTIQAIVSDAKRRNVPVLWWVGPSTHPDDLGEHLERFGFTPDEDLGMAIDLLKLDQNLQAPPGFSLQLAQDDVSWREWSKTMWLGFEVPNISEFMVDAWQNLLSVADSQYTQAYIGWYNGKPVASSLLFLAAGVAGIYAVATVPEARRRGIGAWMTYYPLQQACAKGYQAGVLEASEMGVGVYRSLGFQEYCRISSYRWGPKIT